ncbi:MAG TPA: TrmH family RNA methyltransferase [Acidimicrobiia bacterium]|nr:TrmH family RNA methyltransferase [Acidimicrobiia bacterium]
MAADIASSSNPRIKRLAGLRDRKARDLESVFLVEGMAGVERATAAGYQPLEVYYDPARHARAPFPAETQLSVEQAALDRASYRGRSQGVIAVFRQFDVSLNGLRLGSDPLLVVVEAIEKPGNLGAILRTADAVGAAAVIAAYPGTDPFNPNVIRASTGTLFSVPLAVSDLEATVAWLGDRDIRIVAADPDGTTPLWSADLTGACALLVGAEHDGLTEAAKAAAGTTVSIPMRGSADSLNASVAAAVLAYEALRQRLA